MSTSDEPKDPRTDEELALLVRQAIKSVWASVNELESRGWSIEISVVPIYEYGRASFNHMTHPDIKITKTKHL